MDDERSRENRYSGLHIQRGHGRRGGWVPRPARDCVSVGRHDLLACTCTCARSNCRRIVPLFSPLPRFVYIEPASILHRASVTRCFWDGISPLRAAVFCLGAEQSVRYQAGRQQSDRGPRSLHQLGSNRRIGTEGSDSRRVQHRLTLVLRGSSTTTQVVYG